MPRNCPKHWLHNCISSLPNRVNAVAPDSCDRLAITLGGSWSPFVATCGKKEGGGECGLGRIPSPVQWRAGGHSQDTGKRRVAAGSGCEFSSLWAAGQRGAAARSSEQMCMSGRDGRGWREVAGGSWMGGGWAGGKVGHSRVIRVSSSNKDSALLCGHTAAYGNALVHSCW